MAKTSKSTKAKTLTPETEGALPEQPVKSEQTESPKVWKGPGALLWEGKAIQPGEIIPNYRPFTAEYLNK